MSASVDAPKLSPIATLFPGYFALVMATGIIAVGASQQKIVWLPEALYAIAAAAYITLTILTIIRVAVHNRVFATDLTSHAKGFAFLTTVAATNVLGSASAVVHGWWDLAWILWWVSLALWAVLLYSTLIAVVLRGDKPRLGAGINGTWFLLTVSTESIAALGALLLPEHPSDLLAFTCIAMFLLGIVLYLIVMTMVFLRWTFQELEPTEADPPAWIAAGAVAITVLAGSNLLGSAIVSPRLTRLAPVLEAFVTLAWVTATFWFPLMVAIGVWRHIVRRIPIRYHPSYWALVFPLGMYGAATFKMRATLELAFLDALPKVTLAVALAAWALTFAGLAHLGATTAGAITNPPTHNSEYLMDQPALPTGLVEARRTPIFDLGSVPQSLAESHRTTVWAELVVQKGSVRYIDLEGESQRDEVVDAGDSAVIVPGIEHRIEPSTDAEFFVQFYREPDAALFPVPAEPTRQSGPWELRGRDLDSRDEILEMVTRQYVDIVQDDLLEPYFDFDAGHIDWQAHIGTVADYWCHVLLYAPDYEIDVIEQHRSLHQHHPFEPELFDRWLEIFHATVASGWVGPNADRANKRATGMAWAMAQRFLGKGVWRPTGVST